MLLTGYHGTALDSAENILKEGKFSLSADDKDWLGRGIYFYFDINDAYKWRDAQAILHSVIKVNDDEYLDMDSKVGADVFLGVVRLIAAMQGKTVDGRMNIQKNQCAVMNLLWDLYPKLRVVSASFPTEKTVYKTLLDVRPKRKEFCVRNNNYIKITQLIKRSDLDD